MKKRPSVTLLTVLLAMVFAAGIGVYSSYIGMKIYQESSDHLLESFSQISETFTLFVQRNWTVLSQWDGLLKDADIDHADSIGADMQANKESWHYSDFYLFNESTQYLTADGRRGSADSISGVIQEMYSEGGPIVSTYTASYGVPKIAFAMPLSRNMTLDGVTYTGLAVSYDTDVVDDLVDGSMYGGKSDCYIVRANGDIVLALEPQTELCEGMTNLYDIDAHAEWKYGSMDDIKDCVQLGRSGSAQFTCQGGRNYLVAIPTAFPDWTLVGIIRADEVDGAMHSVQQSTIIALGALCIFAVIIVVLALGMESQLRLRREEEERLSLEREKMQSDRLLQSMSRIVDRYYHQSGHRPLPLPRAAEQRAALSGLRAVFGHGRDHLRALCRADRNGKRQALAPDHARIPAQRAATAGRQSQDRVLQPHGERLHGADRHPGRVARGRHGL